MTSNEVWVIKIIFGIGASLFAVFAAYCTYLEVSMEEKHEMIRSWFREKWLKVKNSYWHKLPEIIIENILQVKANFVSLYNKISIKVSTSYKSTLALLSLVMVFSGIYFIWNFDIFLKAVLFFIGYIVLVFLLIALSLFIDTEDEDIKPLSIHNILFYSINFLEILFLSLLLVLFLLGGILWLYISLQVDIQYALLILIALFPLMIFAFNIPISIVFEVALTDNHSVENYRVFSFAMIGSFFITYFCFFIGHIAVPHATIPKTLQMIISNVLFDGITMVITFMILKWAISSSRLYRIPCAIFIDLFIAGVLACASLYFGLIYSENEISLIEVWNVLLAKSPDGTSWELSPYFWAMHTTFIPSLIYLSIIFFAWIGKLILTPVAWFFGKGQAHKNPLKLTVSICTLISVILTSLAYSTGAVEDYLKEKEKALQNKAAVISITKEV